MSADIRSALAGLPALRRQRLALEDAIAQAKAAALEAEAELLARQAKVGRLSDLLRTVMDQEERVKEQARCVRVGDGAL